jgi:hypothetical protein
MMMSRDRLIVPNCSTLLFLARFDDCSLYVYPIDFNKMNGTSR